ncbi:MAG: DUF3592 domain-containing protein [Bacteroidetes bacterium]|nr:DUF3592 domain-containing protein [Bacteroidota bacterium]
MYLPSESLPPRSIPLLSKLIILNGGFSVPFGWAFFGFGMIFFWVFFMNSEAIHWFSFQSWEPTQGKIIRSEYTNASENDVEVMKYIYEYEAAGKTYTGRGYTTGYRFSEGQVIDIEVAADNPEDSRIQGARKEMFGWGTIFVVIFPLVGLAFILFGFRSNMKSLDLLTNGKFARGKLKSKEPTNTRINEQTVYKYTFEFEADNGRTYEAIGKTHIYSLLEDEETERLIYAPNDPSFAVMFDTIAGRPEIAPDGSLAPISPARAWVLILPFLTILGHGAYYYFRYM